MEQVLFYQFGVAFGVSFWNVYSVGKTTTAYNLIKSTTIFRRVSELDIIRTIVRSVIHEYEHNQHIYEKKQHEYSALFKSIAENDLDTAKQQSKILIPYVREIVLRQQRRKIPTIIEGTSIIPSTYFVNGKPIDGFEKNVVFVNLYISDEAEHYRRRIERCMERDYKTSVDFIYDEIKIIRKNKNTELHLETECLSKIVPNVFSIDIANKSEAEVTHYILQLLKKLYDI